MTKDEIKKEWDAFIEYPNGSSKLYVTTTSALLFARCIADMAADKEREACAKVCEGFPANRDWVPGSLWGNIRSEMSAAIRARTT